MEQSLNNIYYTKVGQGPHLCFLHGFCEDQRIWKLLIDELSKNYTCIAIDLPGFGKSNALRFKSLPEVAQAVSEIIRQENALNCVLFGHSMGGYLVAEYIHQFGSELRAAAFVHSTALADSELKKEKRAKTIDFISKNGSKAFFPIFITELVAARHLARLESDLAAMVTNTPNQSIIDGHTAMMSREDRMETVSTWEQPVLYLKGEKDNHYGIFDTAYEAASCNLAQISEIKEVAHLSMLEDSSACLKVIQEFLNFVAVVA